MKRLITVLISSLVIVLASKASANAQTNYKGSTSLELLYGENFEPENINMATLTPNYSGSYRHFEHNGFIDIYYETNTDEISTHLEWYPRVSLTDQVFSAGPLKEILLGGGVHADFVEGTNPWAWLAGPTWQFSIPGFDSFTLETYYYKQIDYDGNDFKGTYQITPSWNILLPVSEQLRFRLTGVVDFFGDSGPGKHHILAQPQFLLDLGNFWDNPGQLYLGTEWRYWYNKGGVEGVTESVFQWEVRIDL